MPGMRVLHRIGPAFIVGACIIGPGSVTLMSRTGSLYGYSRCHCPRLRWWWCCSIDARLEAVACRWRSRHSYFSGQPCCWESPW